MAEHRHASSGSVLRRVDEMKRLRDSVRDRDGADRKQAGHHGEPAAPAELQEIG
jgi:hypothetical protein